MYKTFGHCKITQKYRLLHADHLVQSVVAQHDLTETGQEGNDDYGVDQTFRHIDYDGKIKSVRG